MARFFTARSTRALLILFLPGLLWQCGQNKDEVADAVASIPMELEVRRFEQAFDQMQAGDLKSLQEEYPYLFPAGVADSVWTAKHRDSLEAELRDEVRMAFPDFEAYREGLEQLFRHARFYFPEVPLPDRVVTLTTRVDIPNRVVLTDSLLLIGLDNYLGSDHRFYSNIDRYVARGLDPAHLISDVGGALAARLVPGPDARSFVSQMVYYGKILYLKDRLLPKMPDSLKIGYTRSEMQWAEANESQIWRYFVERELLFDTGRELQPRFLDPAPFSKFRLVLDNESPGRIGRFMGWQIVRAYMEQEASSLKQMLQMPGEELFRESGYKPPKP